VSNIFKLGRRRRREVGREWGGGLYYQDKSISATGPVHHTHTLLSDKEKNRNVKIVVVRSIFTTLLVRLVFLSVSLRRFIHVKTNPISNLDRREKSRKLQNGSLPEIEKEIGFNRSILFNRLGNLHPSHAGNNNSFHFF
jgi:hypothetical protein